MKLLSYDIEGRIIGILFPPGDGVNSIGDNALIAFQVKGSENLVGVVKHDLTILSVWCFYIAKAEDAGAGIGLGSLPRQGKDNLSQGINGGGFLGRRKGRRKGAHLCCRVAAFGFRRRLAL